MSEDFFYYIKILGLPFVGLLSSYGVYKATGVNTGVGKLLALMLIFSILFYFGIQVGCSFSLIECDEGFIIFSGILTQNILVPLLWFFGFLSCLELFLVKFLRVNKL